MNPSFAAPVAGAAPAISAVNTTAWVLIVALVLLLAWEAWTLKSPTDQHKTISRVVVNASKRWLLLPFLLGVLIGHWFWPMMGCF